MVRLRDRARPLLMATECKLHVVLETLAHDVGPFSLVVLGLAHAARHALLAFLAAAKGDAAQVWLPRQVGARATLECNECLLRNFPHPRS